MSGLRLGCRSSWRARERTNFDVSPGEAQRQSSVENGATKLLNEPQFRVVGANTLELADTASLCSALGDSVTSALEDDGEIHAENTSGGIIFNSEINVLIDTKSEVA